MILIFDLDDTLYDEMTFVRSGLRAVAHYGKESFAWDAEESQSFMLTHLQKHGRGKVFDEWLRSHGSYSAARVAACVSVYRHHRPEISLFPSAERMLTLYQGKCPMYLVTDGHKMVQKKKIEALKLEWAFKHCFITHRYGIRHAKPSLYCFDLIRRAERCSWSSICYVGDNPAKDFVNLNLVGALTVRTSTGSHASVVAPFGYDASATIPNLLDLPDVLEQWQRTDRSNRIVNIKP
jgi:putative hydrolase of the HAD superfamily